MHLLFSILITEKRFTIHPGTESLRPKNRPSVACSTIDGLRAFDIQSADFYLEFDETTEWARETVLRFIEGLNIPFVKIHNFRLSSFFHWKSASDHLNENVEDQLLLYTNDDHVFVCNDNSELQKLIILQKELQLEFPGQIVMVPLSHFPEHHALLSVSEATGVLKFHKGIPLIPNQIPGGPILISKHKFRTLWHKDFTGGSKFVGLENPFGPSLRLTDGLYIPPRVEILRHLDSYGHVGLYQWPFQPLEPTVIIETIPTINLSVEHYVYTQAIKKPRLGYNRTIPAPQSGSKKQEGLPLALYMSTRMRPSLTSLRWTASAFDGDQPGFRKALANLAQRDLTFLLSLLLPNWVRPEFITLRILHLLTKVIPSKKFKEHYFWYLTYGSAIGYVRLFWLSLPSLINNVRALRGRNL